MGCSKALACPPGSHVIVASGSVLTNQSVASRKGWDVTTGRRKEDPDTVFFPPHPSVRENIEAFARAAGGEATYPVTYDEMLSNVDAFEAITRSALSGRVEPVG